MKSLSLLTAIALGFAVSVAAQTNNDQQQQPPPSKAKDTAVQQNTEEPVGPVMGHSSREQMKDTSQPTRMKSGATANAAGGLRLTDGRQAQIVGKNLMISGQKATAGSYKLQTGQVINVNANGEIVR